MVTRRTLEITGNTTIADLDRFVFACRTEAVTRVQMPHPDGGTYTDCVDAKPAPRVQVRRDEITVTW